MTPPPEPQPLRPLAVDTIHVVQIGMGSWAVALVVCLLAPALHTGDRHWWPWACVTGLVLGLLGLVYLYRGRGNAANLSR